jgi:hypothetical protein
MIRWAVSKSSGRAMPLDAAANENGNLAVVEWGRGTTASFPTPIVAVNPTKPLTPYWYMSHFVTCPNAVQHRRSR